MDDLPETDTIRTIVAAMLASDAFKRSDLNRALLQYLAEAKMRNDANRINEYTIAQDIFQRDDTFDPGTDPIVRVRMRRLRDAIARYNATLEDQSARLSLPTGRYVLDLSAQTPRSEPPSRPEAPSPAPPQRTAFPWLRLVAGLTLVASCALVLWLAIPKAPPPMARAEGYPIIRITPFENLTENAEFDFFERGFQQQFAADLQRFGHFRIDVETPDTEGKSPPADFIMEGLILALDPALDIVVRLSQPGSSERLIDRRITGGNTEAYSETLAGISEQVTALIAGAGGAIDLSALPDTRGFAHPFGGDMTAFRCVMLTNEFLRHYDTRTFLDAHACFDSQKSRLMKDATLAASWGTLRMHAVEDYHLMQIHELTPALLADPDEVKQFAERLADRYPGHDGAQILAGAVRNLNGETLGAITALERAQRINPANPTASGVLAYALMSADRLEDARAAAKQAIRYTANPQPYLYLPIGVAALASGETQEAATAFRAASQQVGVIADASALIAAFLSDDTEETAQRRAALQTMPDVMEVFRPVVKGPDGQAALTSALRAAGLTLPNRPM